MEEMKTINEISKSFVSFCYCGRKSPCPRHHVGAKKGRKRTGKYSGYSKFFASGGYSTDGGDE
jgi:hypothetical protein